jgi:hypothetical protein
MAMQSFLFGGQTGKTPEQVAKQRELAQLMASQASRGPKNVGEGLTAVGQALAYRMNTDAANKGENEGRAAFAPMYDALFADDGTPPTDTEFAGIMGHDWASPGQRAVAQALQQRGWNQQDTAADRAWQERFRAAGWGREDARDATQWERGAPMRDLELQQAQLDYQQDLNPVPDPGFTMLAPDEVASAQLPAGSYQRGPDGKVYEIGGGGVEINMPGAPMIGTIPPSYAATQDPTTQAWSMAPIPGSPAAAELEADAARAGAGAESDAILTDTVTGAAQNIRGKIGALTTGVGGWMLGNLPRTFRRCATPARPARRLARSLRQSLSCCRIRLDQWTRPTRASRSNWMIMSARCCASFTGKRKATRYLRRPAKGQRLQIKGRLRQSSARRPLALSSTAIASKAETPLCRRTGKR